MAKSPYRLSRSLPFMMARLSMASWETIFRRGILIAGGSCGPAEYQRMMTEKADAMRLSASALMANKGPAAVLAPFLARASSNAIRLRRKT